MSVLTNPIKELNTVKEAQRALSKERSVALISGCVDSEKWNMAAALSESVKDKIIVTYSDIRVKEIYEDYRMYDKNVRMFPEKDLIFYQADVHGNKIALERIAAIKRLLMGLPTTLITTFSGLMNLQVSLDTFKKSIIKLSVNGTVTEDILSEKLLSLGYERIYQVERPGQFSRRGCIIDVFDFTEDNPYRIELWGDEISSIRSFDIESQRSIENLESITVYPATEIPLTEEAMQEGLVDILKDSDAMVKKFRDAVNPEAAHRLETITHETEEIINYIPWTFNKDSYIRYFYKESEILSMADYFDKGMFILDEPTRIMEHADAVEKEFRESMKQRLEKGYLLPKQTDILLSKEEVLSKIGKGKVLILSTMQPKLNYFKADYQGTVNTRSIPSYNNSFADLIRELKNYKKRGFKVLILSGSHTRAKRLADDIAGEGIPAFYSEDRNHELIAGEIMTMYGRVMKGFEYPDVPFAVIAESDIFGSVKKKKKSRFKQDGKGITDFNDLHVGDYVVHESFGIGIYKGIEKVEVDKVARDYMRIEYKDGGVLYVPATSLDVIMKYASADAKKPKINKLGTKDWTNTTGKVKTAVNVVAEELVELYAKRRDKQGYKFGPDTVWQREFEELFPYEETKDQLDAIEATKEDMESTKIMDRLICGDVGFGKTEVAIRAAFKAIQDGKQVVFLVPTTILAEQHYNTFTERMKDFPVRVDLMSRFVPASKQKKTLEDLKSGIVDIVIGTHRVLSKDLKFKDLGLLIIDEEQRFGVTHKEKIKQLKDDVDVLTLTATPIPRTLHMSLVGIRDMSLLEEAPNDRLPIQTYVMEYDEEMVREAIVRELSRNGQVYYVFNRVTNIADTAAKIQALVPEATVAFAHGQMKESEIERVMYDFIKGDIDVLVSTTIIETGIDIPNVNTIIIHDSDRLGLSQLYQLRGRVGRSNRTAYAFLMYKRDKVLKEVEEKRLETIREFTDLGSGYKIAMRDLEIRGAGNILGMSQHGHMAAVGYDLYCKMLNQAVMKKKGLSETEDFLTTMDLNIDAFIPAEYILNEIQKLDTYKRIAALQTEEEVSDMYSELIDRFGAIPKSVENLLKVSKMRIKAHKLFISEVKGRNGEVTFTFLPDAAIKVENIDALIKKHAKKLTLYTKGVPVFTYRYPIANEVNKDEALLMLNTDKLLSDMVDMLI
jgi:transcription-repair coupling factor (superfamily II helicase)